MNHKTKTKNTQKLRKRIGRLKTVDDLAKFMKRATRKVAIGGEGSNDWYKAAIVASMTVKVVEAVEFEKRLEALEKKQQGEVRHDEPEPPDELHAS